MMARSTPTVRTLGLSAVAIALCAGAAAARGEDRFAGLDEYVRAAMDQWQVPGLAIAVVKDGEVVLARGYGVRRVGGEGRVTPETVFPIASCTKSFTACCIGLLVDEGKLRWDDPVRKHLPDFRVADPYVTEHATVRDLLCHRTGLVRGDLLAESGSFTHDEMLKRLRYLPQAKPFRSRVAYNSLMYDVLGEVVAAVSGMSWREFVARRVFQPLGMNSTTTDRATVAADRLATRHRMYDGKLRPLRTPVHDQRIAPAAAIHSTAGDMAAWLKFHLREGQWRGARLVRSELVREMHTLQQSIPVQRRPDAGVYDARFVGTGLGWYVRDFRGRKLIKHGGAWGAETALLPEEDLAVVVLSNRDWNGLAWMLVYDVIDAYLVGPGQAWSRGKKWEHWLHLGGPDAMDRVRKQQRAELETHRRRGTQPSRPLAEYAGTYRSPLYHDLQVRLVDGRLRAQLGDYAATLDHWEDDDFYAPAVVEPFLDWLVAFDVDEAGGVRGLEITHVGWAEPDERFIFTRRRR